MSYPHIPASRFASWAILPFYDESIWGWPDPVVWALPFLFRMLWRPNGRREGGNPVPEPLSAAYCLAHLPERHIQ